MMNTEGQNILFIGGVPRSGTTLIQKMLDMHSEVYAGPEFDNLPSICQAYSKMKLGIENGRQRDYYDLEGLRHSYRLLINELLFSKMNRSNSARLSEKTPGNVLCFEVLAELFPRAKFIFVVRDPRAVMNSLIKVGKKAAQLNDNTGVGLNVFNDIRLIERYMNAGIVFCKNHAASSYILNYEDLVSDSENELRKLCVFLKLNFEESMLDISKENDSSRLVNEANETMKAWSEPGDLERAITTKEIDAWKKELPSSVRMMLDYRFGNNKIESYQKYTFKHVSSIANLMAKGLQYFNLGVKKLNT